MYGLLVPSVSVLNSTLALHRIRREESAETSRFHWEAVCIRTYLLSKGLFDEIMKYLICTYTAFGVSDPLQYRIGRARFVFMSVCLYLNLICLSAYQVANIVLVRFPPKCLQVGPIGSYYF
jgi:hypothetical protein